MGLVWPPRPCWCHVPGRWLAFREAGLDAPSPACRPPVNTCPTARCNLRAGPDRGDPTEAWRAEGRPCFAGGRNLTPNRRGGEHKWVNTEDTSPLDAL